MKYLRRSFGLGVALLISIILVACSDDGGSVSKAEKLVMTTTKNKLTIISHFKTEPDLYGFVVRSPNQQAGIVYTTLDGKYFFSGQFYGSTGINLTQEQFETYIQPKAAQKAYVEVSKTAYIQQGKDTASHKIYAVVDPNCLYCHKFFEAVQPAISTGHLAVRWVVVGMLKASSKTKALAILGGADQLEAMKVNESGFKDAAEEGGILGSTTPSAAATKNLARNMAFMKQTKIMGTPAVIYQTQGGIKQIQSGMPQGNINKFIDLSGNAW